MAHDSHRRHTARLLASLPLLPLIASAAPAPAVPLPRLGDTLPLPDMTLLDGSRFKAADAAGRVVVVYWWASWCPFCAQQSPEVEKLWRAQRAHGLSVLGVSIDERMADARDYLLKRGYTFPSAWTSPEVRRQLPKPTKGLPVTCVRGRDGRVVMAEAGQLFPEDIEQIARFL